MAKPVQWLFGSPLKPSSLDWPLSPIWFKRLGFQSMFAREAEVGGTAAVREGHRWQKKVASHFAGYSGKGWFVMEEVCFVLEVYGGKARRIYIDVLMVNPLEGRVVVVECKRTWVASAYEQIWGYMAAVRAFFPRDMWDVEGVVVAKLSGRSYDSVGPVDWLVPGPVRGTPWDGVGLPRVGVVYWGMGSGWRL